MELISIEKAKNVLRANKEFYLANALLAKEIQKNTQNDSLIFDLGLGYLKGSNYEAAKNCFHVLKKADNIFEYHYYYAKCCEALHEMEQAREAYLDALLLPTLNGALLFEAYKNIGNIYLKEKNIDVAEDFYHKAYALSPDSEQLMVNLGTLEMQKSDISKATERFRKALQINPQFSPAWVGLALSYHHFGDFSMAWASLLKAVETDATNTTALLLLAQWSVKNNSISLSMKHLMHFFDQGQYEASLSLAFIELCVHTAQWKLARWELERALLWDPKNHYLLQFDLALAQQGY